MTIMMLRTKRAWASVLAAIAIISFAAGAFALPEYYVTYDREVQRASPNYPKKTPGCTDQPTEAYGTHAGVIEDTTGTTFSLMPLPEEAHTICKGQLYTLKVDFPGTVGRFGLLTSEGAVLGDSNAYTNHWEVIGADVCAGKRLLIQPLKRALTFSTTLQVPCSSTEETVMLRLSSAEQGNDPYQQLPLTLAVVTCPNVDCPVAAVRSPSIPATVGGSAPGANSTINGTTSSPPGDDKGGHHDDDDDDDGDDHGDDDTSVDDSGSHGGSSQSPSAGGTTRGGSATPVTTTTGSTTTETASGTTSALSGSSATGGTVGGSGVKCVTGPTTATCIASTLGYQCSQAAESVTTHFVYGTCVPNNECTNTAKWTASNGPPSTPLLHIAAEARTSGYVSVGFARSKGNMPSTDAVLGYIGADGKGFLNVFPLSRLSIGDPYPDSASMLSYSQVVKTSDGRTIICFARPLNSSSWRYSASLDPTRIQLNQAYSTRAALVEHNKAGGLEINVGTGAAAVAEDSGETLIYVHGAMMVLAWIALAPLGALLARHRWALGEKKLAGIHVWFQMHRMIQVVAVLTAGAAFIIALMNLEAGETTVGKAHKVLGFAVMAGAVLQVLFAVARPKPDTVHRHKWNLVHWWLGRITIAAAITVCYLGIVLFHRNDEEPYARWVVPTAVWLVALVVVEITLSLMRSRQSDAHGGTTLPGTPEGGNKPLAMHSPARVYGDV